MQPISYDRHRFPPEVIRHAIWLYVRFTLSYRDVEELLAERGLDISYETARRWVLKFGPAFAAASARRHLASGRDGGLDPGPAHVPVAGRRQRGRDPRSPGPAQAGQGRRPEADAQARPQAGLRTSRARDRPAALLRGRPAPPRAR